MDILSERGSRTEVPLISLKINPASGKFTSALMQLVTLEPEHNCTII